MAPKKAPAKPVSGRAGNYRAPVDTTGMDPEMKRTLTERRSGPFQKRAPVKRGK